MIKEAPHFLVKPTELELEGKVFRFVCLAINLFVVSVLLNDLLLGSLQITLWLDSISLILLSTFNYLAWFFPYRRRIVLTYFFLLLLISTLSWFILGGMRGPSGFNFLALSAVSIVAIKKPHLYYFSAFFYIIILCLTFIEVWHPDWVNHELDPSTEFSLPISFVLVSFSLMLIVIYLKNQYDGERALILSQNKLLADNNQLIAAQNEELNNNRRKLKNQPDTGRKGEKPHLCPGTQKPAIGRICLSQCP
ncbi:MAG: hypothetical protein HC913_03835 [Microscillaceae bacterium]|nr:hypothetical protein [Microscillaceae bacterium]